MVHGTLVVVTNGVFHPSSRLHSSLWLLPLLRDSWTGEAQDLVFGFHAPPMRGVAESGGVALPMRPGFPKKAFSSECACGVRDP
jgi:hypothetical protein